MNDLRKAARRAALMVPAAAFVLVLIALPSGLHAGSATPDAQWKQAQLDSVPQPGPGTTPNAASADSARHETRQPAATDDAVSPKALIVIVVVTVVVLGGLILTAFQ